MQQYLVGGAVRDALLKLPVKDRDWVVVGATPELLRELGYQQVGKDFPVFLHPQTSEEYALARQERKKGYGYTGFDVDTSPDITLEQDLIRRDLTINAIAQDQQGNLIDPFNGLQDLTMRILRHISPAFCEDPLRVLRVARFYARFAHLGFTIATETLTLMTTMVQRGELDYLTSERVWIETEKALATNSPQLYFSTLHKCGALKVLFPEIDALFGVPNPPKHHPEIDSGIHTLMVLAQATALTKDHKNATSIRFAALCHDLGKALSPKENWPHHYGHEQKGLAPIKRLCQRLKVPNQYRDLALLCCEYHTHIHRITEMRADTIIKFFNKIDVWRRPENLTQLILVCIADSHGRTGFESCDYPQANIATALYQAALTVNVQDIIQQGYEKQAIKEQLTLQRIKAVEVEKAKHL